MTADNTRRGLLSPRIEELVSQCENALIMAGTMWGTSGLAVESNANCSH
jgi:hypothetical protein